MSEPYVCPCRVCPRCGFVDDMVDEDWQHPIDGLAGPCFRCRNYEWWSVVGPMESPDRCPKDAAELAAWHAFDNAVLGGLA